MVVGLQVIPCQYGGQVISFLKCLDLPIHCVPSFAHSSHLSGVFCKLKNICVRLCILYMTDLYAN